MNITKTLIKISTLKLLKYINNNLIHIINFNLKIFNRTRNVNKLLQCTFQLNKHFLLALFSYFICDFEIYTIYKVLLPEHPIK